MLRFSLMLEAVTTDLFSPSASSAAPKIFSYPQAGHGRLPHLYPQKRTSQKRERMSALGHEPTWKTCGNFSDESRSARQDNPDLGKCTGLCIDLDCARVLFHDDVVTDREAKARTFSRRLGREERFKHLFLHVRRNACAVIPNPDLHMIAKVFGRGGQSRLVAAIIGICFAFGRIEAVCNQIK